MTTRLAPAVVVAVIAAAAAGILLSSRPVLAFIVAALLAAAVTGYLLHSTRQRLSLIVARARTLAAGEEVSFPPDRDPAWRAVFAELAETRAVLSRRMEELATERARVLGVIERLPPPILLFSEHGLTYANDAARTLFRLDDANPPPGEAPTPMQALGTRTLADAVERTAREGVDQEAEATRKGRVFVARTSRTMQGEVALVLTDLTQSRRLDAVRRDFVTNASHELKTPVAGIQALADSLALAMARDPQRAVRMVARMEHEAARLATLVRELLDLARVEETSDARVATRIDLSSVVRTQLARARSDLDDGRISLRTSLDDHGEVNASVEDARMIVDNLISNAIRYNRPGGSVDVTLERRGDTVVLAVADTGIGIPEADRERVFERFYRVDKARSREVGGTGLGLSLVRHAAQRMGGAVSVSSALGQGSTFTVELPAAPDEASG